MPSVSCDFCPLVYHLDCLDPPICEIPTVVFSFGARFKQEHWPKATLTKVKKKQDTNQGKLNEHVYFPPILGPLDVPKSCGTIYRFKTRQINTVIRTHGFMEKICQKSN